MGEELSLKDWLNQQPLESELRFNDDGSCYIPIEFIKPKLDYLSPNWGTINFKHNFYNTPDGRFWCSASVELSIEIKTIERDLGLIGFTIVPTKNVRVLSGSSTFDVQKYYPNTNWGQTALSLCIVAASKELGKFFGKELNKEMLTMPTVSNSKKDYNKNLDKLSKTISKIEIKKS